MTVEFTAEDVKKPIRALLVELMSSEPTDAEIDEELGGVPIRLTVPRRISKLAQIRTLQKRRPELTLLECKVIVEAKLIQK